jgi:endo-alpha-1,4-polygalactosaminidase (GH114 family)
VAEAREAFAKGDGDRTRIMDSYACGLLVPSENGKYTPVTDDEEETAAVIAEYGDKWDWWWREQGLDETKGRETWLEALRSSDYDVIYIDSFYNHRARPEEQTPLTAEEVESLKHKPDGGRRKVIAYLNIGSAEQNRWYCQDDWIWIDPKNKNSFYSMKAGKVIERATDIVYVPFADSPSAKEAGNTAEPPAWLAFDYGDDYPEEAIVQWWSKDWRDIIINGDSQYAHKVTGDNTSSLDRIMAQGFDGVFLDNAECCVDSFWEAFEKYWLEHGGIPE